MKFFWEVFVTLFVIIDPAGTVPVFLGLTRGRSRRDRNQLAWQATIVAFSVIVAFALFGRTILDYLGVGLPALEGAGGLLLLLVALELLTGKAGEPSAAEVERANVAFVPLGTPLLAGPGAIVATMLYVQRIHGVGDGFALAAAMAAVALAVWLAMRFALVIHRLLTDNGVELVTRIAGLLLAAIAVQLVANSAIAFAHSALFIGPDRKGSCGRKSQRTSHTGRNQPMTARIEQVSSEGTNAWIIGDDEEVIVIDPGRDPAGVLDAVGDREVLAVICTHGHPDHVAAALEVAEGDEAPVALHPRDQLWWRDAYPEEDAEIEMADGGVFEVADVRLEVIHAPGHTAGSVCLYCEDLEAVFTGHTLTADGPVPHDGEYPDFASQLTAIGEYLLTLPGSTRVLPGEGEETTIAAAEKNFDAWASARP
ncbi:MAG TPA: MarC family protein [Streptosporangiaceae bacterium]|nr:MarC family protein [Streptosporangiaceae bacterium]